AYADRQDTIEAVYKMGQDQPDTADMSEVLKELHRIVNRAIRAAAPGQDYVEGRTVEWTFVAVTSGR
ncbi:hypothetical protein GX408_15760, partial [bacterium]|nr:hypothetical protein [bacterium]